MVTGRLLTSAVTLLVWVAVRRRSWLTRAGRAFLDACARAAEMWVPIESSTSSSSVDSAPEPRSDHATRAEAVLVARLYAGELTKADYHRAMAELAAHDAVRHPMPDTPLR